MSKGAINFSSDNEYYTPKWLVDLFGKFDYDPATTKEKAEEFGVLHYDTIETDGLKADWTPYKRIWINPPFTIKHLFFKKAVDTFRATGGGQFTCYFPSSFSLPSVFTRLWANWAAHSTCRTDGSSSRVASASLPSRLPLAVWYSKLARGQI